MTGKSRKIVLTGVVVLLSVLALFFCLYTPQTKEIWNIHFFNAGKADAAVVYSSQGCVVIDAGESGEGTEILDFLRSQKIESIDVLIITHFDKDHVGGAAELIRSITVRQVLECACVKIGSEYKAYLKALHAKDLTPLTVEDKMVFTIGSAEFEVLGTNGKLYTKSDSNNASLLTSMVFGENRVFFAADAEHARLQDYINGGTGHYDLVKMPYHGNWDGILTAMMDLMTPKYAVITSSEEYPENEKTVKLLESKEIETFLTRQGPVSVVCDGEKIKISQSEK